jgi:hypothetical protein
MVLVGKVRSPLSSFMELFMPENGYLLWYGELRPNFPLVSDLEILGD